MVEEARAEEKRAWKPRWAGTMEEYGFVESTESTLLKKGEQNLSSSSCSLIHANVSHWTAQGLVRGQWNPGDPAWEYQVIWYSPGQRIVRWFPVLPINVHSRAPEPKGAYYILGQKMRLQLRVLREGWSHIWLGPLCRHAHSYEGVTGILRCRRGGGVTTETDWPGVATSQKEAWGYR